MKPFSVYHHVQTWTSVNKIGTVDARSWVPLQCDPHTISSSTSSNPTALNHLHSPFCQVSCHVNFNIKSVNTAYHCPLVFRFLFSFSQYDRTLTVQNKSPLVSPSPDRRKWPSFVNGASTLHVPLFFSVTSFFFSSYLLRVFELWNLSLNLNLTIWFDRWLWICV